MQKYSERKPVPKSAMDKLANYSDLEQSLLFSRGIKDVESAEKFLHPNYDTDLHNPFLLKGMERVVKRIEKAIEKKENFGLIKLLFAFAIRDFLAILISYFL
jgi:hypothetical protein